MIGKKNTGKSTLIKAMMKKFENKGACIVISDTEISNKSFSGYVGDSYIFDTYTPELLKRIMKRQETAVSRLTREERDANGRGEITRASLLFIMDDCAFSAKEWNKDPNIKRIFMNGRHFAITFVLTLQDPMLIRPALRTNADWVFLLKDNNYTNRKKLWEHYAGIFPTFDAFNSVMLACTHDYRCLVVNNRSLSNEIQDVIFWWKAPIYGKFRVGDESYWRNHLRKHNPRYNEHMQERYEDNFRRTNRPKVRVRLENDAEDMNE